MSETTPINDVPESNGTMEQPAYNGETEEHAGKFTYHIYDVYDYFHQCKVNFILIQLTLNFF